MSSEQVPTLLRLFRAAQSIERKYERFAPLFLAAVLLWFAGFAWLKSSARSLWYDELMGLAVSLRPDFHGMIEALARPVDISPPLYHLLARWSIQLAGYSALAARLPAFLGFTALLVCLYCFVGRRLPASYGIAGILVLMCVPFRGYAWEGRPYGLLLGLAGLALVAYQQRIYGGGKGSLALWLVVCAGLPLTHYYGPLVLGPFIAAEAVRTWQRKRLDGPLIGLTFAVPCAVILLLRPLIQHQTAALVRYNWAVYPTAFMDVFALLQAPAWSVCLALAGVVLGFWVREAAGQGDDEAPARQGFSDAEMTLAVGFFCLPFLGMLISIVTHAFANRYFLASCLGFPLLIAAAAHWIRAKGTAVAATVSLVAASTLLFDTIHAVRHRNDPRPAEKLQEALEGNPLPVVFEEAQEYVQARELNPGIRSRLYVLADPEKAVELGGKPTDDILARALASLRPENVVNLDQLRRTSPEWIFVPSHLGEGWVSPCLKRMRLETKFVDLSNTAGGPLTGAVSIRLPEPGPAPAGWCQPIPPRAP